MAASEHKEPGRNDPCPCGSGRKYKKCCLEKDREIQRLTPEILEAKRRLDAEVEATTERLRTEYGVWINYVAPVEFQGQRVWAIGSRVYMERPRNETFHEFLLHILRTTLGEEWRTSQKADPKNQHVLMTCFDEYATWANANRIPGNQAEDKKWGALPNGRVQYLISLAWDVATLIHATAANLPLSLVNRIRNPVAFQGARYEIAIAAIFARLDCEIRFLDEDEELRSRKHVEFVATHRPSGQEIAVEVKSRHRTGVLNQEGHRDQEDPLRGDERAVRRLFVKALEKGVEDMPLMVFIDINAPPEPEAENFDRDWQQGVQKWMHGFDAPTAEKPDIYNALYVTNFSPHYDGADLASPGEWLGVRPIFTRTATKFDLTGMLDHALNNYGRVPDIGDGGAIAA